LNNNLSVSMQDYIEAIYKILEQKPVCRVTDIKEILKVTKPSVVSALTNLKELGLIEQERYGYISLTEQGVKKAKNIYDKHLTIKKFLLDIFEIEESDADETACKMEHIINKKIFYRMKAISKNIRRDGALMAKLINGENDDE